ncbi:glycosyltransferase [Mesorhizobium sp. WSM2239]|uniref:Glycosyltransferase n=2 Tax=unclassified Mesorhizobium TaxID=325217 RepID=A0AAU8D9K2_9HYPH
MTQPRILFYVQHLLGIGHLARASRVATALAEDGFAVTVVTGGTPVAGFPGPGVTHVPLPAVTSGDQGFSGLTDLDGNPVDDEFKARRRDVLLSLFTEIRPDIVIIEAFPFGRRQMLFELRPLLDAIAAAKPRPRLVTSVRDILQERVKPGRNEESAELIDRYFDLVMVHGDPAFARLDETFPLAAGFSEKIAYTGLVAGPEPEPAAENFDVLISAGGGAAGGELARTAVEAAKLLPEPGKWGLITGPNLPQGEFDAAVASAPESLEVFRFRKDFAGLLGGARLSVSQAGYNTVCDILRAGCRSLLVPFAAGGETEQEVRAERLERLGLTSIVSESGLTPALLAGAIEAALAKPRPPRHALDLDGARKSALVLRRLL